MACIDVQLRHLPSGRGGRILIWLVSPRRPPLVLDPYPEEGVGDRKGWWGLTLIDEWYLYYEGHRESFMP